MIICLKLFFKIKHGNLFQNLTYCAASIRARLVANLVHVFQMEILLYCDGNGASAELVLQDGGQRSSHLRQPYFRDEKGEGVWHKGKESEGGGLSRGGSEERNCDGGNCKNVMIRGT